VKVYTQRDREVLFTSTDARTFTKRSRIVAEQQTTDFTVETDRGVMEGKAGDWLVTNHPDDDPESDLWSISDERMRNTYMPMPGGTR
jgi:hypothetical protein